MKYSGFDWDKGNLLKCTEHGLTIEIIEGLFLRPLAIAPDPIHSETEERFKAIGRTRDARSVLVVFTLRSRGEDMLVRPISARYMHKKEIAHYEKTFKA